MTSPLRGGGASLGQRGREIAQRVGRRPRGVLASAGAHLSIQPRQE